MAGISTSPDPLVGGDQASTPEFACTPEQRQIMKDGYSPILSGLAEAKEWLGPAEALEQAGDGVVKLLHATGCVDVRVLNGDPL